ncbi:MAG: glycosyltransferase [Patescibacteria group bacterium]
MSISVIVPCYNEETNIQKGVLDKIGNYTKDDPKYIEVIIADDASTDKSKEIIKSEYLKLFPKFKLLELPHGGKANTVIAATKAAKGDYIFMTDMDLATPIEDASKLISKQQETGSPVVIGSRGATRPDAPLTRKIMALGMIALRTLLIGLARIKDTQCGFKMFKKDVALSIFDKLLVFKRKEVKGQASVSAIFDLEFLYLARKFGYKIEEVPVVWRHVETKRVSFVKDVIESLTDMARLKWYDLKGRYNA